MAILYGRFFIFEANSIDEGLRRISMTFSSQSLKYRHLSAKLIFSFRRGYGYPFFEDGGALIEIRPSLELEIQLLNYTELPQG